MPSTSTSTTDAAPPARARPPESPTRPAPRPDDFLLDRRPALGLALLGVLYFALCFWRLGGQDLVLDELTMLSSLRMPLAEMIPWRLGRGHPPLFFVLMWAWVRLFGESFPSLMAPPMLIGAAGLPLALALGRALGLGRWAWVAALLWTLHNVFIYYARMARPYSGMIVLAMAALWLMLRVLESPTRRRGLALAAVGLLGALWNHNVALVWLGGLAAAALTGRGRAAGRAFWLPVAAALLAHAAMIALTMRFAGGMEPIAWIERPGPADIADTLLSLVGGNTLWRGRPEPAWIAPALLLAGMVYVVVRACGRPGAARRPEEWPWRFLALATLLPPAALLVESLVGQPVFVQRYLVVCLPGFVLALARLLADLRPRPLAPAATLAALTLALLALDKDMAASRRTGLRAMCEKLAREYRPDSGDVVMAFNDDSLNALRLYTDLDEFDAFVVPRRDPPDEQWRDFERGFAGHRRLWALAWRHRGGVIDSPEWPARVGAPFFHSDRSEAELWGYEPPANRLRPDSPAPEQPAPTPADN